MAKRPTRSISKKQTAGNPDTFEAPGAPGAPGMPGVLDQAPDMGGPAGGSASMASEPPEEEIRMRAYRRYLERGGSDGQDFDDWLAAERELKQPR